MNRRDSEILNDIISRGENGGIPFFAAKYHVSERTVRNDLKAINEILSANHLPPLTTRPDGSICYYGDKQAILGLIKGSDFYRYKLSKDERQIAFSLILLFSGGFVTLAAASEKLSVSRTTLINDLEPVKRLLRSRNLEVESHPNRGLRLLGRERERRRCIMDIILTRLGLSSAGAKQYNPFSSMILSLIGRSERDRDVIEQIIKAEERKNNLRFSDSAFVSLACYLTVAIGRMRTGNFAEDSPGPAKDRVPLARDLLAYATDYFSLPLREGEVRFLGEILAGFSPAHTGASYGNAVEIQVMATRFIQNVSRDLHIDLTSDFTFYTSLEKHLRATLLNRFDSLPQNSALELIRKNYPDVMRITKQELPILENYVHHRISENELSYLAMHICAAIERKRGNRKHARVAVVCSGGVGTSELLVERLKQRFDFQIVAVTAAHNADTLKNTDLDLILSTVSLKDYGLDFLQVSPFLDDADYLKICKYLDSIDPIQSVPPVAKQYTSAGLMQRLRPLVAEYVAEAPKAAALDAGMTKAIAAYFGETPRRGAAPLYQLLTPDKIRLNAECFSREDAVRQSAGILLEQGYITRRYIEAILENLKENGPYFVLSPGFAVPHAGLGNGSRKMGMSLLRLKRPVPFGSAEFDPVEFVCCLSAVDSDSHLKAFFDLVNLLRMEPFKQKLHDSETPEEVNEIIRRYESGIDRNRERS